MQVNTKVGVQPLSEGAPGVLRADKTGALVVSLGHAKHTESVLRKSVYTGANPQGTPVTTQAGLSATTPALTIYNPIGSGVYAVLLTCTIDITSSPAAAVGFSLAYNEASAAAPGSTTDATLRNNILSDGGVGRVKAYRVATLAAAPVAIRYLGGVTGASSISPQQLIDHIDGEIVLGPGTALSIQSTAAAAIVASLSWEEFPIC